MVGYIYLTQKQVGNYNVYIVSKSDKTTGKKANEKAQKALRVFMTRDPRLVEIIINKKFSKKFGKVIRNHFIGDYQEMINVIESIIKETD